MAGCTKSAGDVEESEPLVKKRKPQKLSSEAKERRDLVNKLRSRNFKLYEALRDAKIIGPAWKDMDQDAEPDLANVYRFIKKGLECDTIVSEACTKYNNMFVKRSTEWLAHAEEQWKKQQDWAEEQIKSRWKESDEEHALLCKELDRLSSYQALRNWS